MHCRNVQWCTLMPSCFVFQIAELGYSTGDGSDIPATSRILPNSRTLRIIPSRGRYILALTLISPCLPCGKEYRPRLLGDKDWTRTDARRCLVDWPLRPPRSEVLQAVTRYSEVLGGCSSVLSTTQSSSLAKGPCTAWTSE